MTNGGARPGGRGTAIAGLSQGTATGRSHLARGGPIRSRNRSAAPSNLIRTRTRLESPTPRQSLFAGRVADRPTRSLPS